MEGNIRVKNDATRRKQSGHDYKAVHSITNYKSSPPTFLFLTLWGKKAKNPVVEMCAEMITLITFHSESKSFVN